MSLKQSLHRGGIVLAQREEVLALARVEARPNLILTVAVMNLNTNTQNILRKIITHNNAGAARGDVAILYSMCHFIKRNRIFSR